MSLAVTIHQRRAAGFGYDWGAVAGGASGTPWGVVTGGVDVIRTDTWARAAGSVNGAIDAAARAGADAAVAAAVIGATGEVIRAQAQMASLAKWVNVRGGAQGVAIEEYERYQSGINDRIVSVLQAYTPASIIGSMVPASSASEFISENALAAARSAVGSAGGLGLGAALGISGTVLAIGVGVILLLVLRK